MDGEGKSCIIPPCRTCTNPDPAAVTSHPPELPPRIGNPRRHFLTLPAEIRLHIYHWLIPPDGTVIVLPSYDGHDPCRDCRAASHKQRPSTTTRRRLFRPWRQRGWTTNTNTTTTISDGATGIIDPPMKCRAAELLPEDQLAPVARYHVRGCGFCCSNGECRAQADAEKARREGGIEALATVMGLMGTCRVLYAEVSDVFYARVMFRVRWMDLIYGWKTGVTALLRSVRRLLVYESWILEKDVPALLRLEMPRLRQLVVDFPRCPGMVGDLCHLLVQWVAKNPMPELRVLRFLYRYQYQDWFGCAHSLGKLKQELDSILDAFVSEPVDVGVLAIHQPWEGRRPPGYCCDGRTTPGSVCECKLLGVIEFPFKLLFVLLTDFILPCLTVRRT
ncbi:hypothetical protein N657DRAFT_323113 [Parathielavia appendiculata]|uniref:Uncharacterized protein n=1 Tax=Parathielavia appendiculata TaxID=2587402 RepID=A0AAN6TQQ0_9PEZI|nr:hypothetical protein N657DRAFT_323113 [Parathielavia appendiculata]